MWFDPSLQFLDHLIPIGPFLYQTQFVVQNHPFCVRLLGLIHFPSYLISISFQYGVQVIWPSWCSYTGCLNLLATPKFPYVLESRKKHSPKIATLKKLRSPGLATPKLTRVGDSAILWGWQVLDSAIFWGWPVQDFFWILANREIWGWQEGSDTLYIPEMNTWNCSKLKQISI